MSMIEVFGQEPLGNFTYLETHDNLPLFDTIYYQACGASVIGANSFGGEKNRTTILFRSKEEADLANGLREEVRTFASVAVLEEAYSGAIEKLRERVLRPDPFDWQTERVLPKAVKPIDHIHTGLVERAYQYAFARCKTPMPKYIYERYELLSSTLLSEEPSHSRQLQRTEAVQILKDVIAYLKETKTTELNLEAK